MKDKIKATRKKRNEANFMKAVARGEPSRYNHGGVKATKRAVSKARRQEFTEKYFNDLRKFVDKHPLVLTKE